MSTVGRVHPHVQIKTVDADGRITALGTPGELLTRGYSVMGVELGLCGGMND